MLHPCTACTVLFLNPALKLRSLPLHLNEYVRFIGQWKVSIANDSNYVGNWNISQQPFTLLSLLSRTASKPTEKGGKGGGTNFAALSQDPSTAPSLQPPSASMGSGCSQAHGPPSLLLMPGFRLADEVNWLCLVTECLLNAVIRSAKSKFHPVPREQCRRNRGAPAQSSWG